MWQGKNASWVLWPGNHQALNTGKIGKESGGPARVWQGLSALDFALQNEGDHQSVNHQGLDEGETDDHGGEDFV